MTRPQSWDPRVLQLFIVTLRESRTHPECMQKLYLAVRKGHVVCMKHLHISQSPIEPGEQTFVCKTAAEEGQLLCLQFAHQMGYFWDAKTCKRAA